MKNFCTRLLLFVSLLILVHVLVSVAFPVELPPEVLRLDEHLRDGVDVHYFGDSTLYYPVGEVTTGEILQEMLPDRTVGQISHSAYGLDVYLHYLRYVVHSGHLSQTVVIPINLRSFSPEWDMRPAYQFAKEKQVLTLGPALSSLFLRPFGVMGLLDSSVSQEQFLEAVVWDGDVPVGTVRDFEEVSGAEALQGDAEGAYRSVKLEDDAKAQETLLYHYMFGLEPDHRKLDAMVDIAELCEENDIVLNLHNHTYEVEDNEHDLNGTLERLPDVKLGPDLNWLLRGGVDPVDFIKRRGKQIVFLHLRDQTADGKWSEAMGEGDMDYAAIGQALTEAGFSGEAVIELAHEGGLELTRPLGESLKMSREYVRETMGY